MKRILRKIHWFLVVFAGLVGVTGCSNTATRDTTYSPREDQKLIVYTSHKKEVYGPIVKEFEERTGIWVQVKDGGCGNPLVHPSMCNNNIRAECDCTRKPLFYSGRILTISKQKKRETTNKVIPLLRLFLSYDLSLPYNLASLQSISTLFLLYEL